MMMVLMLIVFNATQLVLHVKLQPLIVFLVMEVEEFHPLFALSKHNYKIKIVAKLDIMMLEIMTVVYAHISVVHVLQLQQHAHHALGLIELHIVQIMHACNIIINKIISCEDGYFDNEVADCSPCSY